MIYLDSSALLKLLVEEAESEALQAWLDARVAPRGAGGGEEVVSSELTLVEVIRAIRRLAPDAVPEARVLVGQLHLLPVSSEVLTRAADVGDPLLRSLDALHLASALSIAADIDAFVAYDLRLAAAARAAGLAVVHPGVV